MKQCASRSSDDIGMGNRIPSGEAFRDGLVEDDSHRQIRILFLVREQFPTFRPDIDVLFGKELLQRNHKIDFVMQAADPAEQCGERPWRGTRVWVGATTTGAGFWSRLRKHLLSLKHDFARISAAQEFEYDAIQVKDKFLIALWGLIVAQKRNWKFFFWLSFPVPEAQRLRGRLRLARYPMLASLRGRFSGWLLYHWILPRSDHIFVQSERMRSDVCRHGVDPGKVTAIPMGVDLADFNMVTDGEIRPERSEFVLGYLGTLARERRLDLLVEMLANLRNQGIDAKLLFVGDGDTPSDRAFLEDRAFALGVSESVEITGFVPRAHALRLMMSADVGVSPFYPTPILESTSPTKLVEYLALGLPVIANHHPEQRLVLRQSKAGVCVPWGVGYFSRAARYLIRRGPEARNAMGLRGRQWVENNRTYTKISDLLEQKYLDVLARKG